MRAIVGREGADRPAASTSQMGRFETEWLATKANLAALSGTWIDRVHARRPPDGIILDLDSSESPTHGEQEVDDERVVELANIVDRLDHAADLVIRVGEIGGVDVSLADVELLGLRRERVPLRNVLGPGRELGVLGDHAELLLVGEDRLAQLV